MEGIIFTILYFTTPQVIKIIQFQVGAQGNGGGKQIWEADIVMVTEALFSRMSTHFLQTMPGRPATTKFVWIPAENTVYTQNRRDLHSTCILYSALFETEGTCWASDATFAGYKIILGEFSLQSFEHTTTGPGKEQHQEPLGKSRDRKQYSGCLGLGVGMEINWNRAGGILLGRWYVLKLLCDEVCRTQENH